MPSPPSSSDDGVVQHRRRRPVLPSARLRRRAHHVRALRVRVPQVDLDGKVPDAGRLAKELREFTRLAHEVGALLRVEEVARQRDVALAAVIVWRGAGRRGRVRALVF